MHMRPSFAYVLLLCLASTSQADVQLPNCFSDHMVLQRDMKVPIWGTADAGEKVTVRFREQEKTTTAAADGTWRVELDPLEAGGTPNELTVEGKNTLTRSDVLVGEVWIGSGQSNMQGGYAQYLDNDPELGKIRQAGPYPEVRALKSNGTWAVLSGTAAFNATSALLTPFAVKLHQELKVPVGMMLGAVGGTPSGAWVSEQSVGEDSAVQEKIAAYAKQYDKFVAEYEKRRPEYEKQAAEAKAANKQYRMPPPPSKPGTVRGQKPGYLYQAHIKPFAGYAVRGVLWDQGESGTAIDGVDQYTMMGALIRGWRKEFGIGDFTFIYVQKPSGGGCAWDKDDPITAKGEAFTALPKDVPSDGGYLETHIKIMNYPNTAMAISSDLGSGVHPSNKSGYGRRAADVALGAAYGKPVEFYGPTYKSHKVEGDKIRITFTHTGKGLAYKHGEKLQGFAVAGADKKFHWADAEIDGDTVVVSCQDVPKPEAVRYAYASRRTWANLFNQNGLPAIPFRTDSW
jgi:sialate O-acetylesterase